MSGKMIDIGRRSTEPCCAPTGKASSHVSYSTLSLDAKDFPELRKAKMGQKVRVVATLRKMHDGAREETYGDKRAMLDVEVQAIQESGDEDFAKNWSK